MGLLARILERRIDKSIRRVKHYKQWILKERQYQRDLIKRLEILK